MKITEMGNLDWCCQRSGDFVMSDLDPVWFDPKGVCRAPPERQEQAGVAWKDYSSIIPGRPA